MLSCPICAAFETEKCHVKDKTLFHGRKRLSHNYQNIISLCSHHHHAHFDKGRLVITDDGNYFIWLKCIKYRKIKKIRVEHPLYIKSEYIIWKNSFAHTFLKSELRKHKMVSG